MLEPCCPSVNVTPLRSVAVPDASAPADDAAELAGASLDRAAASALLLEVAVVLDVAALFDAPAELHAASRVAAMPAAKTEIAGRDNLRTFMFPSDDGHAGRICTDL
jgi:hypothetical protein